MSRCVFHHMQSSAFAFSRNKKEESKKPPRFPLPTQLTSNTPKSHGSTESNLAPVEGPRGAPAHKRRQETWQLDVGAADGGGGARAQVREVQAEQGDGEEGQGARGVVEALRLVVDGRHGKGGLDRERGAHAGDERPQQRAAEVRHVEEVLKQRHDSLFVFPSLLLFIVLLSLPKKE